MERLEMSTRERRRLEVLSRVKCGDVPLRKAAELLQLSYWQVKRVYGRYRDEGDAGLVHRLRGRASNQKADEARRQLILESCREICARSSQAKGHVERRNGVLQDRLVKALRLLGISHLESANTYLEKSFLAEWQELPERPAPATMGAPRRAKTWCSKGTWKPPAGHPWRRFKLH